MQSLKRAFLKHTESEKERTKKKAKNQKMKSSKERATDIKYHNQYEKERKEGKNVEEIRIKKRKTYY